MLTLGGTLGDLSPLFAQCERAGAVSHPYAMPRRRFAIYWCRDMKRPLQELWPQVKKWDQDAAAQVHTPAFYRSAIATS